MATGHGGVRKGAGPPKGCRKITGEMLRIAIENKTNKPYEESMAEIYIFLQDLAMTKHQNVREFLQFVKDMNSKIIEESVTNINITATEMTPDEIDAKLKLLGPKYLKSLESKKDKVE